MNKRKTFTGYCPTQDNESSISISYLEASDLEETFFIKNTFYCVYNRFGDKCSCDCPIYNNAPEEL